MQLLVRARQRRWHGDEQWCVAYEELLEGELSVTEEEWKIVTLV